MSSKHEKISGYWEIFVNALPEAILILDKEGKILYVNNCAAKLFNTSPSELIEHNFSYPLEANHPIEIQIIKNQTETVHADLIVTSGKWKNEDAWIAVLHDITEKKVIENKLRISANVFKFAKEGILIVNTNSTIVDVNEEFTKITGYSRKDAIGKTPKILQSGMYDKSFYQSMWDNIKKTGYWYGEIWNKKKDGTLYPQLLAISQVKDEDNEIINYVGVFYDITQQEQQKKKLERIAHYDTLTELPNRVLLISSIESAIERSKRSKKYLAIIFIDLDGFKQVNDNYGHDTGDLLLVAFSKVINTHIRITDMLARYGGDEFILMLTDLDRSNDYNAFLERIYKSFKTHIKIKKHKILVQVSMGVTIYPQDHNITPEQLIRQADQAMYHSKISGKNKISIFNAKHENIKIRQNKLINQIETALKNDELILYYQPKVNMKTKKIFGAEGLIRWQHPDRGLLLPGDFMPAVIQHADFLIELTQWTINEALSTLKLWEDLFSEITISINVDAIQLERSDFINQLKTLVRPHSKKTYQRLELEILESSVISNLNHVDSIIKRCNDLGIQFSLDDFGTGYSSINYLVALPFKYMKIDMNFIRNIIDNQRDIKILNAILSIAEATDIAVIAEGVETVAHEKLLLAMGCTLGQGFAFSKALSKNDFECWAKSWQSGSVAN